MMPRQSLSLRPARLAAAALVAVATLAAGAAVKPPAPVGAVPAPRQLAWHALGFYGFLHFGMNTFTDKEWGYGDEDPRLFDPSAFDARQWARVARDAGMKGLIITAKHHDGFCLWPSRHTAHSVKASPWKGGKGDVVGELAAACREYGLRFGVYLSPWDRNHAAYGRPEYLEYYRNQLRELLTAYGPVFEVWFDGANGGDGYYGGARETRHIDRATYYDWAATWRLVRELQPDAVMFSDAGPDVRWVGNERGLAFETSWNAIDLNGLFPGHPDYVKVAAGSPDGTNWVPPEVDVSIRPGWFYHQAEDAKVKSLDDLVRIYEQSIGRGTNLLLNIPPDRRGLIAEADAARLRQLAALIEATYKTDLARGATALSATVRGGDARFAANRLNDGNDATYWATDDGVVAGAVEMRWPRETTFDCLVVQEHIALGQRVEGWSLEAWRQGAWAPVAAGTTIGYRRIARFAPVSTDRIRFTVTKARACPTITTLALYQSPER